MKHLYFTIISSNKFEDTKDKRNLLRHITFSCTSWTLVKHMKKWRIIVQTLEDTSRETRWTYILINCALRNMSNIPDIFPIHIPNCITRYNVNTIIMQRSWMCREERRTVCSRLDAKIHYGVNFIPDLIKNCCHTFH